MRQVDIAIIGAGTAGLSARKEVARATDNYVVIDQGPLGTTCARVGCMPSKALIQTAKDFYRRRYFSESGISGSEKLTIDPPKVMAHVRKLRDYFIGHVLDEMEAWRGEHLIEARAAFDKDGNLTAGGETIRAKRVVIATGSSPITPPGWREDFGAYLYDTDTFFDLEDLPARVAVIGLGVIGAEMAQALARLGVKITAFDPTKSIGGLSNPELMELAVTALGKEFDIIHDRADLQSSKNGITVSWSGGTREVDCVLLATGRKPNLAGLGLENLGVALDDKGMPEIDQQTLRVKGAPIYIAGDATGDRPVLHEASDEGRIAGYNAVHDEDHEFERRVRTVITFCDPEIAIVGESHQQLKNRGADFVAGKASFKDQGRARVAHRLGGEVHVYAGKADGKIYGAEMFAPGSEHFAHLLASGIEAGATLNETLRMPFYHPVLEEGVRTALRDAAKQTSVTPPDVDLMRCSDTPVG